MKHSGNGIQNKKLLFLLVSAFFVVSLVAVLYFNAVDNTLTEEDKKFIPMYMGEIPPLPENPTYQDELNFIVAVQHSVLQIAPGNEGLPCCKKREPKELYMAKTGLCYDRSRVIEKVLRYYGFTTRHISLYSKAKTDSAIKALMTPGVSSHAITEVLTKRGWLVVDSNAPWVSTDINNEPMSISDIQAKIDNSSLIQWKQNPPTDIYLKPFVFLYGLYSRHGYFYPPYNMIPDINYKEFIQNVL